MILFLDCANGVSGDMLVAALLELAAAELGGEPLDDVVRPALATLGIAPDLVASEGVRRGGVAARAFTVAEAGGFGTFDELIEAVSVAALPPSVVQATVAVARRMAQAEARVHGGGPVHLHELSGIDTAVDLVSAAVLLARLSPETVLATPPALGSGFVQTAHGLVAVPAPAVLELLTGWPTAGGQTADGSALGELTTPTGAALLRHYAEVLAVLPAGRIVRVAHGAGAREVPDRPNVLRAVLIDPASADGGEGAGVPAQMTASGYVLLETNIDDMTAELLAHAAEELRGAGACDVWLTSALMKKGRPGVVLHVLTREEDRERLAGVVFAETSSFGLRVLPLTRMYLVERREIVRVEGADIGVRLGYVDGRLVTASPEYEDVRRVAAATGRTSASVYEESQAQARASVRPDVKSP